MQFCKSFLESKGTFAHCNMGTHGGPNHINPIVQFCPRTDITSATLQIALIIFAQRIAVSSTDVL